MMTEVTTTALDLFSKPLLQSSITKGRWTEVRPTNALDDDGVIDFEISGSGTDYIDLANTFIKVKVRVTTPDEDVGYPEDNLVAPVNNLLHSMFNKVDVILNGKTVCSSDYHYAHRAYVETLLSFGSDTKQGELSASFWHEDTPGHFDALNANNVGFNTRRLIGQNRHVISLMGRVHADLFTQPRLMIDGVNVHLKLTRSPSSFCLMRVAQHEGNNLPNFKIKIDSISLFIRNITPSDTCRLAIIANLKHYTVKYPIRRVEMRTFSLANNTTSWVQENVIQGQLPRRITFFFVGTNAVHGDYALNPLHLQHYDINFFSLYVNGRQIPSTALQPAFGVNSDYVRTFMQMQSAVGKSFRDEDSSISFYAFGHGSTVFAFDLTADLANGEHSEPTQRGSLRAEVRFGEPLPHAVTCFVHAEHDNCIEINQDRNISLDYLI